MLFKRVSYTFLLPFVLLSIGLLSFVQDNIPQSGKASYYSDKLHGRKTASGALYDKYKYTAAHRTYPFGTFLEVTNLSNNKSVVVEVNDRGPYSKERLIDLSKAAAIDLGMIQSGICNVKIQIFRADTLNVNLGADTLLEITDSIPQDLNLK